jgi:hypothetical protein
VEVLRKLGQILWFTFEVPAVGDTSAYTKKMSPGLSCTRLAVLAVTETAEIIVYSKLAHRGVVEDNTASSRASTGIAKMREPQPSTEIHGYERFVLLSFEVQEIPTMVGWGVEHLVPLR